MVEFLLEHGADRDLKDTKVGSTAAGWNEYGGHPRTCGLVALKPPTNAQNVAHSGMETSILLSI